MAEHREFGSYQLTPKFGSGCRGNLSGNEVSAGGNANIQVGGAINHLDTLNVDGDLNKLKVIGSAEIKTVAVDGKAIAEVGGNLKGTEMTIGRDANLVVGGDTVINRMDIGGGLFLNGGGGFTFNDLEANGINATVGGSINMGHVTSGRAKFKAGGSVNDNNSMLNVNALTIEAGGNVGTSGKPINLNVGTVENVSGDSIYLLQNAARNLKIGTISARDDLISEFQMARFWMLWTMGIGKIRRLTS